MRDLSVFATLAFTLTLAAASTAGQATSAAARASGPYYAALVASARGSIDATNRQLLLLASRWDAAAAEARSAVPAALAKDPAWGAAIDRATALLAKARDLARTRDIAGAHAQLEEMRLQLHEVRERHGMWTLDDHLAEYHEAVERVAGHVVGAGEINFTAKDYQDVDEDLRAARDSWTGVEQSQGSLRQNPAWQAAAHDTAASLKRMTGAIAEKDRAAVAAAAEHLKRSYFDVLSALAKVRS